MNRRKFVGSLAAIGAATGLVRATPFAESIPRGVVAIPFPAFPEYAVELNVQKIRQGIAAHLDEGEFHRWIETVFEDVRRHLSNLKPGDAFVHNPEYITVRRVGT